jgi:hypothetical protein
MIGYQTKSAKISKAGSRKRYPLKLRWIARFHFGITRRSLRVADSLPCSSVFCEAGFWRGKGDGEADKNFIEISFQESSLPEKEAAFPLTRPPLPLIHALLRRRIG